MSLALVRIDFVSPEEYLVTESGASRKHEYVGGSVYAMAGAVNRHNRIATNVLLALGFQLRGRKCEVFNSDTKVRIRLPDQTRFYYPDAQVVCEAAPEEQTWQDEPVVIVEVISESTRRTDELEKREGYLTLDSLEAYVLLEQKSAAATVWRRRSSGFECVCWTGLDAVIPLPAIDASLSLDEAYRGVDFSPSKEEEIPEQLVAPEPPARP